MWVGRMGQWRIMGRPEDSSSHPHAGPRTPASASGFWPNVDVGLSWFWVMGSSHVSSVGSAHSFRSVLPFCREPCACSLCPPFPLQAGVVQEGTKSANSGLRWGWNGRSLKENPFVPSPIYLPHGISCGRFLSSAQVFPVPPNGFLSVWWES